MWRAEFFSPKDFVCRAVLIAAAFLIVHLLGLRDYTSVLNGTTGAADMSWEQSAVLGVIYVLIYLAFVLLVPILLLAAAIRAAWLKLLSREPRTNSAKPD